MNEKKEKPSWQRSNRTVDQSINQQVEMGCNAMRCSAVQCSAVMEQNGKAGSELTELADGETCLPACLAPAS